MSNDELSTLRAFSFGGTAQHRRGWTAPITIRVELPECEEENVYRCSVSCVLELELARPVRSSEPRHAHALAFQYLRYMLRDFVLFDDTGERFFLPRIAPADDDWHAPAVESDQGFLFHVRAVGPDGEIHPFTVGVSTPLLDGETYIADVFCGVADKRLAQVRGETLDKALAVGTKWIEQRLDDSGLTLLGLWNEPLLLPNR